MTGAPPPRATSPYRPTPSIPYHPLTRTRPSTSPDPATPPTRPMWPLFRAPFEHPHFPTWTLFRGCSARHSSHACAPRFQPALAQQPPTWTPSPRAGRKNDSNLAPRGPRTNRESTSNLFRRSTARPQARDRREKRAKTIRFDSNPAAAVPREGCRASPATGVGAAAATTCSCR